LAEIGLTLINANITGITDESGYIDAIGQKAASLAIQQARGDVADNEKMGETRVASAERDKSIQVSNARKEQSIGTREAQREQAVRIATLEKEQSVGEKTASFEKDAQVKLAEQQMRVQVAEADAGAIDGENQAAARVAASQADLAIKRAEAYERGQYEILGKKVDGLKQIVQACGGSTQAFQMLMLEHLDHLAEASSRAISNIKFDKIVVWENGGHNGKSSTADFLSGMAKTLP